jgi:regulator of RNase E activity RraA
MLSYGASRGVGGLVINGAIRDLDAIAAQSVPVYAAGVTHRGPYKDGPGEINVPIAIDGMVVEPGDLVLGDGDGVLCVPFDHAETVCKASEDKKASEDRALEAIAAGSYDRGWVDESLKRLGCDF